MSAKGHLRRFGRVSVTSGSPPALGPKSKGTSLGPVPPMPSMGLLQSRACTHETAYTSWRKRYPLYPQKQTSRMRDRLEWNTEVGGQRCERRTASRSLRFYGPSSVGGPIYASGDEPLRREGK
jgi:hypothetical protein